MKITQVMVMEKRTHAPDKQRLISFDLFCAHVAENTYQKLGHLDMKDVEKLKEEGNWEGSYKP
jgi:hypothetical protein